MRKNVIILYPPYFKHCISNLFDECQSGLMNEVELEYITLDQIHEEGVLQFIQKVVARGDTLDGIIGMIDSLSLISAIISNKLNLPGPTLLSVVHTQNKYLSRRLQSESVPGHTPPFILCSEFLAGRIPSSFPVILKPVRSRLSLNTYVVNSAEQLQQLLPSSMPAVKVANAGYYNVLTEVGMTEPSAYQAKDDMLIEGYISGEQYTIDGYIYQGRVGFLGVTSTEFIPNTLSFSRFTFRATPSFFSEEIEKKIYNGIEKCLLGAGLDNMMFNVEFRLSKGKMFIIEVNTRVASQFIDLICKVTGVSPIEYMVHIALGEDPEQLVPFLQTKYNVASSCVLRLREDALVTRIPSDEDIAAIHAKYPDVLIVNFTLLGKKLSDVKQDTDTFRYAWVNIPGSSIDDIEQQLAEIKPMLGYEFEPPVK